MWLDGCKIGLTVESEEGEVPHLRWSQAPPLPWPRPGSADISKSIYIYIYIHINILYIHKSYWMEVLVSGATASGIARDVLRAWSSV